MLIEFLIMLLLYCFFVLLVIVFMFFFFFSSRRRHTRWNCDWVQTCALPISLLRQRERVAAALDRPTAEAAHISCVKHARAIVGRDDRGPRRWPRGVLPRRRRHPRPLRGWRSEERRVGKEC